MDNGYTAHGGKLFISEPSEDEAVASAETGIEKKLAEMERTTDLVEKSESAYIESVEFYGGHLHVQAWTGSRRGKGWMCFVRIPMLAKSDARSVVSKLSKQYGIGGSLDNVGEIVEHEVDDYGRVNLGRERSGDTVRLAVLEDES